MEKFGPEKDSALPNVTQQVSGRASSWLQVFPLLNSIILCNYGLGVYLLCIRLHASTVLPWSFVILIISSKSFPNPLGFFTDPCSVCVYTSSSIPPGLDLLEDRARIWFTSGYPGPARSLAHNGCIVWWGRHSLGWLHGWGGLPGGVDKMGLVRECNWGTWPTRKADVCAEM